MSEQPKEQKIQFIALEHSALNRTLRTVVFWIIGFALAMWIFQSNRSFIFMLVLAWLFAISMDPAIRILTGRGWPRSRATGLVMLGVLLAALAFIGTFGGVLFTQAASLISSLPTLVTDIVEWLNSTFSLSLDPTTIIDKLNVSSSQIATLAGNFAGGIVGMLSTIIGGLFQILTTLLFAYYLAAEGPRVRQIMGSWMNPAAQEVFVTMWDVTVKKTGGFVASKFVMAAMSTTAHAIFFAVIGVPYWLPMAIITGITSQFIPTVGTYIGILVPMLFALFNQPVDAIYIALFATFYQQFENYVISPRISEMTMDVHPAIAFGSVIVFANLFGAMGAVVSIPLAAALVSLVDTYGHRYELIPALRSVEKALENEI
jgi:predicted PurR-regulated permease PerM